MNEADGLPPGWRRASIADTCTVTSGATPKTTEDSYWGGDIPWLTPDDLSKNRAKFVGAGARFLSKAGYESCSTRLVPAGSVLSTSRAPIGYVAIASQPVCTNQGFKSASPGPDLQNEFLYWQLQERTEDIRSRASGTTFLEINAKGFGATQLIVPPLDEQRQIVEVLEDHLSRLDAAVASLRTVQAKAEQFRRSVLHSAFSGALTGHSANLGALPKNWTATQLGEVVDFLSGYAFKSEWYIRGGVRLIRGQNISHGSLDWSDAKEITPERAAEFSRFELAAGDLVLALDRPLISTGLKWAVLTEKDVPALLLQRVARLSPDTERVLPGFLQFWIQSPSFTSGINPGRSIAVPHISTKELATLPFPLPPLAEQQRIVEMLDEQVSRIDACVATAEVLVTKASGLRRALLHAAFTGELTKTWRAKHG